jgi:hypothetical protein
MKKLMSFLAIIAIVTASQCSRVPENNDPIIGIWSRTEVNSTSQTGKMTILREWIFNDAYLGRFHRIENGVITIKSDFNWKNEGDSYIINYPGLDRPNDTVTLKISVEESSLQRVDGFRLATRD